MKTGPVSNPSLDYIITRNEKTHPSEVFNSQLVPLTPLWLLVSRISPRNRHLGGRCNFGNIFVKCSRAAQRLSLSPRRAETPVVVVVRRWLWLRFLM